MANGQTLIENTFSLFHFLFDFHVFVMAPSREWIDFFPELWLLSSDSWTARCLSIDLDLTTDDAMVLVLISGNWPWQ